MEWLKVRLVSGKIKYFIFKNKTKILNFIEYLEEDENFHSEIEEVLEDSLEGA